MYVYLFIYLFIYFVVFILQGLAGIKGSPGHSGDKGLPVINNVFLIIYYININRALLDQWYVFISS